MTNDFEKVFDAAAETQDYTGGDGLLYCGSCRTPKQFRMDKPPMEGRLLPRRCQCEQAQYDKEEAERKRRKHLQAVEELKRRGFTDSKMREWTFANDNGKCPQMELAHFYAEHWEPMREENIGYLLWGKVGTGKSYFAGCIANALMEQEVPVRMTNFALILNDLAADAVNGGFTSREVERTIRAIRLAFKAKDDHTDDPYYADLAARAVDMLRRMAAYETKGAAND